MTTNTWEPAPDRYGKPRTHTPASAKPTTQADTLAALADQLATVQTQLRPLQEREAALKAEIRSNLASLGPGEYQAGNHVVTAGATRRIDQALISDHYPAATHPQLYKLAVDTAAVRRSLPPEIVDEHMAIAGDMKITVR